MVSEAAGMTAPMEMSSSPAIISRPMGSATMPISAAMFSQLDKPAELTKTAPPAIAKNRKTATRPRTEPASGRRASWPRDDDRLCASRSGRSRVGLSVDCIGVPSS